MAQFMKDLGIKIWYLCQEYLYKFKMVKLKLDIEMQIIRYEELKSNIYLGNLE